VRRAALPLLALLALAAGCGDDGDERLVVSAAASLTEPLTECSRAFEGPPVRLSFAGSDELAAQIRRGIRPDVFAAANTDLPRQLARESLLRRPRVFASNQLVIAVRKDSQIASLEDLAGEDVVVATGAESVPVGAYTTKVLARLDPATRRRIRENIRTEEPDVKGVVGKVAQGAADAGLVYRTDVVAAGERLRAIELPEHLRPAVAYGAGVVRDSASGERAQAFLDDLVSGRCQRALRAAGFGPAPAP
jgi:molybdate transport system substrate-binding protein